MEDAAMWDEEGLKCRKHPLRPRRGVCPQCLRDRLLRLCPDCAQARPCACLPSSSSASSSSSFSSLSSSDFAHRSGIGAVGRVAQLIESEPAFRRSRSAVLPFLRRRPGSAEPQPRARGWGAIWPFGRAAAAPERRKDDAVAVAAAGAAKMSRSRSVGVESYPRDRSSGEERSKGWGWYFPSPMKAFKHRKSSAKIVQQRSPICRG